MASIKAWLAHPVFESDEEKTYRASLPSAWCRDILKNDGREVNE
ncbi:MAG: hypothetical protein NT121_01410 [Chloroflexi bacterium]|nr:hypothetical protein [Chloroflexota bacterium]